MPAGQKRLLLLLAALLAFQAAVNLIKYTAEIWESGRFGGDFVVFVTAAQQAVSGDLPAIYGKDKLSGKDIRSIPLDADRLATQKTSAPFAYPPHILPFLAPLALFSEGHASALWGVLPIALFYFVLFKTYGYRCHPLSLRLLMAAAMLPMLSANLFSGQTGTWIAILFLAAVHGWERRGALSGVALGLMTVKPHLGILWPVALVMAGRWRVIAVAVATILALAAGVTVWLGPGIWQEYLKAAQFFSNYIGVATHWFSRLAMAPFISLRAVGLPPGVAGMVQIFVSVTMVLLVMRVFQDKDNARQDLRFALLAVASLLAAPYTLVYDSPLLAAALMPVLICAWEKGWQDGWELAAVVMALVMPFAQALLLSYHIVFGMLSLLVLFMVTWRRYHTAG